MTPNEEWRPVVGYEGAYEVSDQGRVRSRHRVLKAPVDGNGYPRVCLRDADRQQVRRVHQLVAEAFFGVRPPTFDTCHNDGDKTNNAVTNLRYDTRAANMLDQVAHDVHWFAQKTHCKNGHEFTPSNTYQRPTGGRACKTCRRAAVDRYQARRGK